MREGYAGAPPKYYREKPKAFKSATLQFVKTSPLLLHQKKEYKYKETFIQGYHQPRESSEFDWGEVKLYVYGKLQRLR